MSLALTFLGRFQALVNGQPAKFATDYARALLAYLAVEARPCERTTLVALLWPDQPEPSARQSLRQTLFYLRQTLRDSEAGEHALTATTKTLHFQGDEVEIDVRRFQGLLVACATHAHADLLSCTACLARLQEAANLYQGEFLQGLFVKGSQPFEEWALFLREQLHRQFIESCYTLAQAYQNAGDYPQMLHYATRQLTLEPWREEAHRQVMWALAAGGQRTAALAQYNTCRQVLAAELSAEPDVETNALYDQIRNGRIRFAHSKEPPVTSPLLRTTQAVDRANAAPIPPQLAPLLGRDEELAQIIALLQQPSCQLVTLIGPPGAGKTRLAQAVIQTMIDSFADANSPDNPKSKIKNQKFPNGLFFIELAALREPALLASTIAKALSLPESGAYPTSEQLIADLQHKALLLVLDNFEQILAGATLLYELMVHCPQLKLLVTSRVALGLPSEQLFPVQPLPLPDLTQPFTLATVAQNAAVQLFCQRATVVMPNFQLTERLAPIVAEICRRLDGLPLAIELAAARSRLLPPPALLARLTADLPARLQLLIGGAGALPLRQQTLRAAIAWSYDLLDAHEQRIFRQLTVFVGGCTLDAAEAVIGDGGLETNKPPLSILDSIESLLDKNLLRQQEVRPAPPDAEPRLVMLETIREYGWEQLAATAKEGSDSACATQQRHAEFFLALAESAAPNLHGATQVAWLDRLALDHDNLRAALDWFTQQREAAKGLRLATALRYFWRVRGHYREGCERLSRLLAQPEAAKADGVRAHALNAAGYLQWVQGNTMLAQELLAEALAIGRASNEPTVTAFALRYQGLIAGAQQDTPTAQRLLQESLTLYRGLDNPNDTAVALMYLGDAAFDRQGYDQAQHFYQEAATLLRQVGNQIPLPYALRRLGYLALVQGDPQTALRLCVESLQLNWAAGEKQGSAASLVALATVAVATQQWVQATRLLQSVENWLTSSHVQLLPFDQAYYEQTVRTLRTQPKRTTSTLAEQREAPLSLEEALAYVLHEFGVADWSAQSSEAESPLPARIPASKTDTVASAPVPLSASPLPTPPHNLPTQLTPLIGREQDLADLLARLQQPDVRLVTLVGAGGMGKTRLALAVGWAILDFSAPERQPPVGAILDSTTTPGEDNLKSKIKNLKYPDGIFFVSLASVATVDALASTIVAALGLEAHGDPQRALLQFVCDKALLLILDNFEHLLEGAGLVAELLQQAPRVQIILTSRERLNVRGEYLHPVPALDYATGSDAATALTASSVQLFAQSARRIQPTFEVNPTNIAEVLRICRLVQGMPLGLELAAANVDSLPLRAIATEIERSADFLQIDWRDAPERQRSMRAVFDWSWRLLDESERQVFRQLAIFRGGFTRAAATTVAGATLRVLTRLVHKSLLQWDQTVLGEGRYGIHELLRQFAAAELTAAQEEAMVAHRHSEYYLAFLAAQQQRIMNDAPREAVQAIQYELDNIRQAWRVGASNLANMLVEQATLTLREFYWLTGLIDEGIDMFTLAARARHTRWLEHPGVWDDEHQRDEHQHAEQRLYSILLGMAANLLITVGRHEEAFARAAEALQVAHDDANPEGAALGYLVQGQALRRQGKSEAARCVLNQAVQLAQQRRTKIHNAELLLDIERRAYSWLASIALSDDDYPLARAYTFRQLEICRQLQKFVGESMALTSLVDIDKALGDYTTAQQNAEKALAAARKVDFRWGEAICLEHLADIAWAQGDYSQAQSLFEQVVSAFKEMSRPLEEASAAHTLGRLYLRLGDAPRARIWIDYAFRLLQTIGLPARETLGAILSRAWYSYLTDDPAQALVDAEAGRQMARQSDGGAGQAYALVFLGLVREKLHQSVEAATAYHDALRTYLALEQLHQTVEPRVGLARLALAADDFAGAVAEIEAILPILHDHPLAGLDEPFQVYLTCYTVLAAVNDARATTILQTANELLVTYADHILEPTLRRSFLENVAVHRALQAAYADVQAKADRVTG